MMRIDCFDPASNVIDCIPHSWIPSIAFHFIADRPEQHSRVVLKGLYSLEAFLVLLPDRRLILVIKSVPLMTEPQAHTNGELMSLSLFKQFLETVWTPRTN